MTWLGEIKGGNCSWDKKDFGRLLSGQNYCMQIQQREGGKLSRSVDS